MFVGIQSCWWAVRTCWKHVGRSKRPLLQQLAWLHLVPTWKLWGKHGKALYPSLSQVCPRLIIIFAIQRSTDLKKAMDSGAMLRKARMPWNTSTWRHLLKKTCWNHGGWHKGDIFWGAFVIWIQEGMGNISGMDMISRICMDLWWKQWQGDFKRKRTDGNERLGATRCREWDRWLRRPASFLCMSWLVNILKKGLQQVAASGDQNWLPGYPLLISGFFLTHCLNLSQSLDIDLCWCDSKATTAHAPLCQAFDSTSGAFATEARGH